MTTKNENEPNPSGSGSTKYGIYDTVDHVWLGENPEGTGPKLWDIYDVARVAAQVVDVQLRQVPGRTVAKEFPPGPVTLKDEVTLKMTTEQALKRIMRGGF